MGNNIDFEFTQYNRVIYQDGGAPALNADNLNKSEEALEDLLGKEGKLQKAFESVDDAFDETKNTLKAHEGSIKDNTTNLSNEATDRKNADDNIIDRFNAYIGITKDYNNNPLTDSDNYLPINKSVAQYIADLVGKDPNNSYDNDTYPQTTNYLPDGKSLAQYVYDIDQVLKNLLVQEQERAKGEEGKLQSNISTESTNRSTEDKAIRDFIGITSSDSTTVKDYVDTQLSKAKKDIVDKLTLNVIIDGGTSEELPT